MTKKSIVIFIILLVVLGVVWALIRGSEDTWICRNGEWIKHGNPASLKPTEPCGKIEKPKEEIIVEVPKANDIVSSPFEVRGKARGTWYFEGDFPVRVLDENGNEIGLAIARAKGDWMTSDFVSFEATVEFSSPTSEKGTLVLIKDNPSGLPEYDKQITVPLRFKVKSRTFLNFYKSS